MRFGGAATAAIALALALGASGCGSGDGAQRATAGEAGAGSAARAPRPAAASSAAAGSAATCRRQLHGLLAALDALRGRLAVGLSYQDYLTAVRGARATHGRIAADRLQFGCVSVVGAPAERALNRYIGAVNTWGDCLAEASCDPESVEPELQRAWRRAAASLAEAQRGLRRISSG
ncbi:MAG TPA: hypothetical protein VF176_10535 [Solirubrobacterales bacterium]